MKQSFKTQVLAVVSKIPKGKVLTYGRVASLAGAPGAARAVGAFMKANYNLQVPCHRVVRADGSIGEYNRGGREAKKKLLVKEGVNVRGDKVIFKEMSE
jgi:O-6-methylguanine DNA methyltransferase